MKLMKTFVIAVLFMLFLVLCLFAQWEPDERLTFDAADSYTSENNAWCVAAEEDTVHVVWYDTRDGNWEIYYKRSTNGGTSWGTDNRLTDDPASSLYPSVAVSGSYVHVTWCDERDANLEIYYKRNPTGNIGIKGEKDNMPKNIEERLTCHPNPFTSVVSVMCSGISERQKVTLEVYDISGRLVKRLVQGGVLNSQFSILNYTWDGRDAEGKKVNAGIYFLKIDGKFVGKVVKMR
ncbi:hypothetical protein ES703_33228 [subsurface metagenome]